jgi:hypothetical protein
MQADKSCTQRSFQSGSSIVSFCLIALIFQEVYIVGKREKKLCHSSRRFIKLVLPLTGLSISATSKFPDNTSMQLSLAETTSMLSGIAVKSEVQNEKTLLPDPTVWVKLGSYGRRSKGASCEESVRYWAPRY